VAKSKGTSLSVIRWIEQHCRIPEGKFVGQPVKLRPFQKKIIRSIYDTPTRRAIVSFGRKNAKTTLSALLMLVHLCGPKARANSQLFSAAQSREQAAILFALAAKIVRMSPLLRANVQVRDSAKQLACPTYGTLYRALSAEASTAYGFSPVFVVHDELGQVAGPRSELYEALETAAGAQENPLSIIISTQAPTDADLLSVLIDDAKTGADPKVKLHLYTAPEELDPFSDKAIKAANPALGDFLNEEEVRDQAASAKRMPAREAAYRNLVLNQRVNTVNPLISRSVWIANGAAPDPASFDGEVFLGLDLSARNDLTAAVAIAKTPDGKWDVEAQFFAPMQGLQDRALRDRQPYDLWAREGFITLTPGSSIDYSYVAQWLVTYCSDHQVKSIKFDRWRIDVLKAELTRIGAELPLEPFGQGFKDMTPAIDALETALVNCMMRHGSNPVMTMCAANAIAIRDAAGNRKLDKSKSTGRIDGIVALAMAIGSASQSTDSTSVYESRGVLIV
jgi:phage terminase large subunit-like protein